MDFKIPLYVAKEIKRYCEQQDFDDDTERESCRYYVFQSKYGCRLHDDVMGFPNDWKIP